MALSKSCKIIPCSTSVWQKATVFRTSVLSCHQIDRQFLPRTSVLLEHESKIFMLIYHYYITRLCL